MGFFYLHYFKAQKLGIYSADYALNKFGDIGRYGAFEFKGMNKTLDNITQQKIIDNLGIWESDGDPFSEFRQDRYETLRIGDDTWEVEIYSDYVGYLELRILNSKFEVVHKVDVLKKKRN